MTWHEKLRAAFGSNAEAAKRLWAAWKKKAPLDAARLKETSLATKIGELAKEERRWWSRHRVPLELLAELLQVDPQELLGEDRDEEGRSHIPFPEFPSLAPLDPTEEPCALGPEGWLVHQVLQDQRHTHRWLIAPAGAGKTLTLAYLASSDFEGDLLQVQTLEEALVHAAQRPLVVEVLRADPGKDASSLAALGRRSVSTIVLASFEPPIAGLKWANAGDEWSFPMHGTGWQVVRATPPKGWRARLLSWIDARLERSPGDTKLLADEVSRWLKLHDPNDEIVRTPGDLLALCEEAHLHGLDGTTLSAMSDQWIERAAAALSAASPEQQEWIRCAAGETIRELVKAHVLDVRQPLGGLDIPTWESHLPTRTRPMPTKGGTPGATLVIGLLVEGGLLRSTEKGTLDVFPRWVRRGLTRTALTAHLQAEHTASWGAFAADESRRAAVDDALDDLTDAAFRALVRRVVRNFPEPPTLAAVAAIQATFSAAARRLLRAAFKLQEAQTPHWHRLAELQVFYLTPEVDWTELRLPFTRPEPLESLADTWTFSFRVPRPEEWAHTAFDWQFPGWAEGICLADAPRYIRQDLYFGHLDGGVTNADITVARWAVTVLSRCRDEELPDTLSPVFVHAVLAPTLTRGWKLVPAQFFAFRNATARQEHLVSSLREMSPADPGHRTTMLWGLLLEIAGGGRLDVELRWLVQLFPVLLPFVLEHLDVAVFEETVRQRGLGDPAKALGALPERLRAAAIRGWSAPVSGEAISYTAARELLPALEPRDVELILDILRDRDASTVAELAPFIWEHDPDRAREEAEGALRRLEPSAWGWFWAAPPAENVYMVELATTCSPRPDWVSRWAKQRMLRAGLAAEQMFALAWGSGGPSRTG